MSNSADPSDVESIEAIVAAAYDVISGPAGKKRDWKRERSLFISGARLIPTAVDAGRNDVDLAPQVLDVDAYIARVKPYFATAGFYEKEVARRVEQFGQIAHVWSTYESRHDPNDAEPFMRGINSIQLFNDGSRWWILSIYWQHESRQHAIPEKYL
ncbi:MAG: hypothetical protein DMF45_04455 [Verrucomicrobia bacterium]|nr:MAG: hypothetical protein DME63_03305 [Verrucomicrobiota bacterium]PYL29835.1 MAG: hypothetical protein DMF45_04455 [Verrucomicrobiota bacterium]